MLTPDVWKQRIVAARTLRGISQAEMDRLGHEDGLGKGELSRLERGEFNRITPAQRRTLSYILRVPEAWFTDEDVDAIVGYSEPDDFRTLAAVREFLPELAEVALALRQEREASASAGGDTGRHRPGGAGAGA